MIGIWGALGVFLVVASIYDGRSRTVPVNVLLLGCLISVLGCIYLIIGEKKGLIEIVQGLLPGIVGLLLARVTKEQLGYGDGIMLLILGGCLGLKDMVSILWIGLVGTFFISIFLLIVQKGNRYTKLPFIPFLLLGFLWVGGMQI